MLRQRIEDDLRHALKAHDVGRRNVLRVLVAAIQNAAIAARTSAKQSLDDADVETVVRQEAKRVKDALVDFRRAARHDLITAAEQELAILASYVPAELSPSEVTTLVREVVMKLRAEGVTEFGRVMGAVVREVKGRSDGQTVSEAVRQALKNI